LGLPLAISDLIDLRPVQVAGVLLMVITAAKLVLRSMEYFKGAARMFHASQGSHLAENGP